jgi:hypothetical protein
LENDLGLPEVVGAQPRSGNIGDCVPDQPLTGWLLQHQGEIRFLMDTTKYWLKSNPSVTAEFINGFEPDDVGGVPAMITQPDDNGGTRKVYALTRLEDWSPTEIVPAPTETVKDGYLALYQGKDDILYVFITTEEHARVAMAATSAIGYVPVTVHTNSMTPAPDDLLVLG